MHNSVNLGMNRTGLQMSPLKGSGMSDYAQQHALDAPPDEGQMQIMHREYVAQAERLGSVPMPGTVKGLFKTTTAKVAGRKPEVLIDKLGERLAFERSGTRLYEAMMMKLAGLQSSTGTDPDRSEGTTAETEAHEALGTDGLRQAVGSRVDMISLERMRHEEQAHMHLVRQALEELGADPTAMTPCADTAGVTAQGVMQTLTDPRTTVAQCLGALLTAELTDHAGWELLMELAEDLGHDEMAVRFSVAATTEAEHLSLVKEWLRTEVMTQAR